MSIGEKKYLITEPVKETPLEVVFRHFLQEKQFLQNIAPNTHDLYARAWSTFAFKATPTQAEVNLTVVALREQGMSIPTLNAYGRCINVFFNWLIANKHTTEPVKVKRLKCAERSMKMLTDTQIQALLAHRPKTRGEARLVSLIALLADAGLRINEALSLRRKDVDFENCLIDIVGKGGRFRRIPISVECRKVLYRYLQSHNFDLVFCNRDGCKLRYPNIRYDFKLLCQRLGINGFDGSFHSFRRYFITFAARKNVNAFVIMRLAGHSQITTTQKYLKLETQDLSRAHVSALQAGGAR